MTNFRDSLPRPDGRWRRTADLSQAAVRAKDADGNDAKDGAEAKELDFTGHAAVFNQRTWIGPKRWGFWEVVDPGFFRDVLDDDAKFLVNHDPNILLARNGNTMELSTDKVGLVPEARWDASDPEAVKWAGRVNRGDVDQMSFAFTVAEESWEEDEETGEETRTLLTARELFDVSLVTYPAYEGTDAGMRDAAQVVKRHRGLKDGEEIPALHRPTDLETLRTNDRSQELQARIMHRQQTRHERNRARAARW